MAVARRASPFAGSLTSVRSRNMSGDHSFDVERAPLPSKTACEINSSQRTQDCLIEPMEVQDQSPAFEQGKQTALRGKTASVALIFPAMTINGFKSGSRADRHSPCPHRRPTPISQRQGPLRRQAHDCSPCSERAPSNGTKRIGLEHRNLWAQAGGNAPVPPRWLL